MIQVMVIVAAVDQSDRSDAVIRESIALAKAFDETVHVVHVLTTSKFVELGRTSAEEGDPVDMDEVIEVAKEIAIEATSNFDFQHETVGLLGEPADRIVQYARQREARYIVVSGRKRHPSGKMIFGSVTQSILLNAESPVVSIIKQSHNDS